LRKLTDGNFLETCSISCNTVWPLYLLQKSTTDIPANSCTKVCCPRQIKNMPYTHKHTLKIHSSKSFSFGLTRWSYKVSKTLIAGNKHQIRTKFEVLGVFATLLFKLNLCFKQGPAHFLICWTFSYQHLKILNWSLPSSQLIKQ